MKTPMQKMIKWVIENAFNVTAEDGTTYIAIDTEEMRLNYDMWLDEEKEHIKKAYKDYHDLGHLYELDAEEYYNKNYKTK